MKGVLAIEGNEERFVFQVGSDSCRAVLSLLCSCLNKNVRPSHCKLSEAKAALSVNCRDVVNRTSHVPWGYNRI